jgi:hypothetical protein
MATLDNKISTALRIAPLQFAHFLIMYHTRSRGSAVFRSHEDWFPQVLVTSCDLLLFDLLPPSTTSTFRNLSPRWDLLDLWAQHNSNCPSLVIYLECKPIPGFDFLWTQTLSKLDVCLLVFSRHEAPLGCSVQKCTLDVRLILPGTR